MQAIRFVTEVKPKRSGGTSASLSFGLTLTHFSLRLPLFFFRPFLQRGKRLKVAETSLSADIVTLHSSAPLTLAQPVHRGALLLGRERPGA